MKAPKLSYSSVTSTLALFIALGGTSWAVTSLPARSVGNEQLQPDAVSASKVLDRSLTHLDIRRGSLVGSNLLPGTISTREVGEGSLNGGDLKDGSVDGRDVADGALTGDDLADRSIPATKLRDLPGGLAPDDPRLTDARRPNGAAGGDLDGSFPDPTLGADTVGAAEIVDSLEDGAAGTATMRSLGTGASQAAAGDDARLSDARTPTGAAGGDLTGSYPDPTLAAGSVDGATIQDGSLSMNDIAAVNSSVSIGATPVPAHTCAVFQGTSGDITADDVIEIYPSVDSPGNPAGIIWLSGAQDADTTIQFRACNITGGPLTVSGGMPISIYRR